MMNDQVENHGTPSGAANGEKMTLEEMALLAGFDPLSACCLEDEEDASNNFAFVRREYCVGGGLRKLAALVRAQALEDAAVTVETCEWPRWADSIDSREVYATAIRSIK